MKKRDIMISKFFDSIFEMENEIDVLINLKEALREGITIQEINMRIIYLFENKIEDIEDEIIALDYENKIIAK
ncbi:hypothetical protein [Clostridium butyricum]|uniref:Uncharacterized protein n=1 Tax=Clostridium butyricum TaxID=1492 RepID=A0A6N2Z673_CLOBU|nr:hypothetical protein [Clostridium butyricum]MDU5102542.1 hypothetical protein [Clostridium butyricum]MZI83000.1 hypothetical protein [Clostridium butyricum]